MATARADADRRRYLARKTSGLCVWCKEPRGASGTAVMCARCATRTRDQRRESGYSRRRNLRWRKAGLCRHCGKRPPWTKTTAWCEPCRRAHPTWVEGRSHAPWAKTPQRCKPANLWEAQLEAEGMPPELPRDYRLLHWSPDQLSRWSPERSGRVAQQLSSKRAERE